MDDADSATQTAVVVDGELYELLVMLADYRNQSVMEALTELVEAEFERIEPGLLEDLRGHGAAIKRLYAATGRPVPAAFRRAVRPEFGREALLRELGETGELYRL
jgi:hexokinase